LAQPLLREKLVLWDHQVKLVQPVLPGRPVLSVKPVLPDLQVLSVKPVLSGRPVLSVKPVLPDLQVQRDLKGKRESQVLPQ
jgi:hypothetical protein